MSNKYQKYISVLDNYPKEVGYYFRTDLNGKNNKMIMEKYNLSPDFLYNLVFDVIGNNFDFQILEKIIADSKVVENSKIKNLSLDIVGMLFFPIDSFLKEVDIKKEIRQQGGNFEDYLKYQKEYLNILEKESDKFLDELIERYEKEVDKETEEEFALNLLKNSLVEILKSDPPENLSILNGGLIYLLNNVENFKQKTIKALMENKEKITSQDFVLKDKKTLPSVGNWVNDFIHSKGISDISKLDLSDYLVKSENVKKLNLKEKELIVKLLNFYRNLKLYPSVLDEMPPDALEIIPIRIGQNRESNLNKKTIGKSQSVDSIAGAKRINTARLPRADELRDMAEKYPVGSLERKAIEEEIRRIEK